MQMVFAMVLKLLSLLALSSLVTAAIVPPPKPLIPKVKVRQGPVFDRNGTSIPPYNTVYEFDQLIDHTNPGLGTFKQRYWHTWEFYQPGGPIILMSGGEGNAEGSVGYLTNATINGQIARQQNGATILLEHRFFGFSNPYPDLTVASLQFLTIQQAIDDLEYFANNVKLPMPGGDQVAPGQAPWVLVGGSYSGALTSYTMVNKPGLFQAGYASSAVVQAIVDFWGYFEPIRQSMPQNCSADVQAVITHLDAILSGNNQQEIYEVLDKFGLQSMVAHPDDAAAALSFNINTWQLLQPDTGPGGEFFQFCDALEVNNGVSAPPAGWGLDHALRAWGSYFTNTYLPRVCGDYYSAANCLGTYNQYANYYTNTAVNNWVRSWFWILCNEVGFWQGGAPSGQPTLVSRLVRPAYFERQCQYYFPQAFNQPPTPNADAINQAYEGWNVQAERIFFANGQRDPWREATLSADNTNFESTPERPIALSDGFHCSDMISYFGDLDPSIRNVQNQALNSISQWLADWVPSD